MYISLEDLKNKQIFLDIRIFFAIAYRIYTDRTDVTVLWSFSKFPRRLTHSCQPTYVFLFRLMSSTFQVGF